MARLTGLSPEVVLYNRFRLSPDAFLRELLGAEWTPLELYDSRMLKVDQSTNWLDPRWFTVLSDLYLGKELKIKSDMPYVGDTFAVAKNWSCSFHCTDNPQALVRLQHAMRENSSLQIMITNGYFDFATPYFGTKRTFSQLEPDLQSRVSITYYKSGHHSPPEHREVVARFIERVSVIPKKSENVHAQSAQ